MYATHIFFLLYFAVCVSVYLGLSILYLRSENKHFAAQCFLLLHNKLSQTQCYNLNVLSHGFCGSGVWAQVYWVYCSESHQPEIKVLAQAVTLSKTHDPLPGLLTVGRRQVN